MTKSGILSQIGYQIEKPSSEEHNIAYQITRSVWDIEERISVNNFKRRPKDKVMNHFWQSESGKIS